MLVEHQLVVKTLIGHIFVLVGCFAVSIFLLVGYFCWYMLRPEKQETIFASPEMSR